MARVADVETLDALFQAHDVRGLVRMYCELDGLVVSQSDGSFNVRPSHTEPPLGLNAEGKDHATMVEVRDAVLSQIRSHR